MGSWVNLRLRGKRYLAVVSNVINDKNILPDVNIRDIDEIINLTPVSEIEIRYWRIIADYYMCSVGEVMKAAYSTNFQRQLSSVKSKIKVENEKGIDGNNIPILSDEQNRAYSQIIKNAENGQISFLHGVTGSGKTEIYIKLALETCEKGKNTLVLVPEIALTRQLKNRLEKVFNNRLLVFHSKQTIAQKKALYSKLNQSSDKTYIILGTRSALFLPPNNLGLIIVDEEHDSSYKQTDPSPRYNGRDAAIMLATLLKIPILLGSATPSFETIYNIRRGKYKEIGLTSKYHKGIDPKVEVIDMNMVNRMKNNKGSFSIKLLNEIKSTVDRGEQVMVFRSRRAYSPVVQCSECGSIPKCPKCNVPLSYHKFNNSLECHYCGYRKKFTPICPECRQSTLVNKGAGTEKIEEELKTYFPNYNVERFDANVTTNKTREQSILRDFSNGKIDILVGTQMITKGFDFEKLSLVAVIQADSIFAVQDFRADERAVQLLTQLRGRAGRREIQGKMVIQTCQPEHPVIKAFTTSSCSMDERRMFSYPPFVRLILITVKDKFEWRLTKIEKDMTDAFQKCSIIEYSNAIIPAIDRVNGQMINQYWIKLPKNNSLQTTKNALSIEIDKIREKYNDLPSITVDVDPY